MSNKKTLKTKCDCGSIKFMSDLDSNYLFAVKDGKLIEIGPVDGPLYCVECGKEYLKSEFL